MALRIRWQILIPADALLEGIVTADPAILITAC
jgi:hypothetical protein